MQTGGVREHARVPVHVENVKVMLHRLVVNPEHAVVEVGGVLRLVVERLAECWCPVLSVKLSPVTSPPQVIEEHQPQSILDKSSFDDIRNAYRRELIYFLTFILSATKQQTSVQCSTLARPDSSCLDFHSMSFHAN